MQTVASCQGVVKTFGATRALDGLDLELTAGTVHGFLGPNGSGKSVTMRILLGLLRHDAGHVELFGRDPWRHAVDLHRRLAYVPGDTNLWPNLTGGEIIDLLGDLRGHIDPARRRDLIERFDLDPTKRARTYSKGNRQKVALVAALASDAELLILDEPTAGLDPLKEAVFAEEVRRARDDGRTVLLSSHVLAEVEKLCDQITIIRLGRTVQHGSLEELRHLTRSTITAEIDAPVGDLGRLPGVHDLEVDGHRIRFGVDADQLAEVVRHLGDLGVTSLVSHPPTLEELFLHHYREELDRDGVGPPR